MRFLGFIVFATLLAYGCSENSDTAATDKALEKAQLDSSAIANDSTRLPNDSTNTGVQH